MRGYSFKFTALTGTFGFHILGGVESAAYHSLELPIDLHFRRLELSWGCRENLWWITELVERWSCTLESLDVTYAFCRACICIWAALITQICF